MEMNLTMIDIHPLRKNQALETILTDHYINRDGFVMV